MNKYLKKLGFKKKDYYFNMPLDKKDKRYKQWKKEKKKYGFDSRETWDLDSCAASWMYCHLKMYMKVNCVDLNFHKFTVPTIIELSPNEYEYDSKCKMPNSFTKKVPKEMTQKKCIKLMIKYLKEFLLKDDGPEGETVEEMLRRENIAFDKMKCAWEIYSIVAPSMWW